MPELRAIQRLQFHQGFTLDDAVPLVPYFASLGISHLYASPIFTARPGSTHGYDVVDPTRINPELGGEPALERLVEALRQHGMGLILDIVPNHMAVGGNGNLWWLDVLEWGQLSPYARFFDIQWQSPDPLLHGQLLAPFLRCDYGEVLESGELPISYDDARQGLVVRHFEHVFPLSPPSWAAPLSACGDSELVRLAERFEALDWHAHARDKAVKLRKELATALQKPAQRTALDQGLVRFAEDKAALHQLLERQPYRLASWRTAADDINWRRFFDINELGGLRVERPDVFEATHSKVFELIQRGWVDGLRIDHVDGLADPRAYCRKLRRRVTRLLPERKQPFYIHVEKILAETEQLPGDWQVDGTTGYDFMNQVSLLQHSPAGERSLRELWGLLSERQGDFLDEILEARRLLLTGSLAGDLETVAQGLLLIARSDLASRDLPLGSLRRCLLELVTHFQVYRTYAGACGRSVQDQFVFARALTGARETLAPADVGTLEWLDGWLGGEPLRKVPPGPYRKLRRQVLQRFQQLTSPAAAKAVEDTACYRSVVLLSRNDVGFDPQCFSAPASEFHQACQERSDRLPFALLATATHDHKRGEDCRARLAVVSERVNWWLAQVEHFRQLAQPLLKSAPIHAADEYVLYQCLLACWPLQLDTDDHEALAAYTERLQRWQEKSLREARLRSSWSTPDTGYERRCRDFIDAILLQENGAELRLQIASAANALAAPGALNGLVQTLLRMTTPGVPDLYQGCEYWDFSLVDPDNRHPVDFAARQHSLGAKAPLDQLLANWRDGALKQWLIARVLACRARHQALFAHGDYQPLHVEGAQAEQVLAFCRQQAGETLIVVAPRLCADLLGDSPIPLVPPDHWAGTHVELPAGLQPERLRGLLPGTVNACQPGWLALQDLLDACPVNLLVTEGDVS